MSLETYLNFGGYPGSYPFISDPNRWKNYIADSIIDTDLFDGSYLIKPIFKYAKTVLRTRSSSPKIILMAPALSCFHRLGQIDKAYLGHVLESAVGADLIRAGFDLHYWREGKFEVDFVIEYKNKIIAIEVKSGKQKNAKGFAEFKIDQRGLK